MSGYGSPDSESEHAMILSENGIMASRSMLIGKVLTHCSDCGDPIPQQRQQYAIKSNIKCEYCVPCQSLHDERPRIRMLDHIL
jgi:RNA polymerase-binding transcription factor DksA